MIVFPSPAIELVIPRSLIWCRSAFCSTMALYSREILSAAACWAASSPREEAFVTRVSESFEIWKASWLLGLRLKAMFASSRAEAKLRIW